jgi:hypothetical protein
MFSFSISRLARRIGGPVDSGAGSRSAGTRVATVDDIVKRVRRL